MVSYYETVPSADCRHDQLFRSLTEAGQRATGNGQRSRRVSSPPTRTLFDLPPIPPGAGLSYHWLTPRSEERLRSRTALAAGLPAAARRQVADAWIHARDWTAAWLNANLHGSLQQTADAIHTLVWVG
jgi:hypothetical protein